jgi:hypothetical protein
MACASPGEGFSRASARNTIGGRKWLHQRRAGRPAGWWASTSVNAAYRPGDSRRASWSESQTQATSNDGLQSADRQRGSLKARRVIGGTRLEVLHLPADVLDRPVADKSGPIGPSTGATCPVFHEMGGLAWINGAH